MDYAWRIRGRGTESVSEAAAKEFREHLARARSLIEQALRLGVKDGHAHSLLIAIARAEGQPREKARAIFDQGREVDPNYVWLYAEMAVCLLPYWRGQPGDLEKFAAEIVTLLPGDDGLDALGHVLYFINQYDPNILFWGDFDRTQMAQAAEVIVDRYPMARNVVPFAGLMTIAAQDVAAARRIRLSVTAADAPRVGVWRRVSAEYRRWCTAEEVEAKQAQWLWGAPLCFGNIAFTADSQSLWCPSGLNRTSVVQIGIKERRLQQLRSTQGSAVEVIAYDAGKEWLVAALSGNGFQGWVRWDADGKAIKHPTPTGCRVIAINPKQEQIAWSEFESVKTFDLKAGKEGPSIDLRDAVQALRFSGDGKWLAVESQGISVWDPRTGAKQYELPGFDTKPRAKLACENLVAFDDEGRLWATAFVRDAKPPQRPLVRFDAGGKEATQVVSNLTRLPGLAMAISADHRLLAVAENNEDPALPEAIQLWNLQTGEMVKRLPGHSKHIESLCFAPDGKRLASVSFRGGAIKVWSIDASDAAQPARPRLPTAKDVTMLSPPR
jgi:hypothetical protein